MTDRLASWRPGASRDALLAFLDRSLDIPVDDRVAYLDNDGTLWCEKPGYVQLDFFVDALQQRAADDPSIADRPEYAAVLSGDMAKVGEAGIERVALALAELYDGQTPEQFGVAVDEFLERYRHRTLGVPIAGLVYQPMIELLDELRAHDFAIGIVTGGGTEFVRQFSRSLYGVEPGMVVGTLIGYEFDRDDADRPTLRRTTAHLGAANEGGAKVAHIQSQVGRPPLFAAGNTGGDREMLEWAGANPHGGVALLVNHDDADREFEYVGTAATFADTEAITDVADRLGWITASMRNDWTTIFPPVQVVSDPT
jgi:phosphoglycolate phosphatase-like HAD superfamily hydrolase